MGLRLSRRRFRIAGVGVLATIAIGIAGVVYALPSAAAAACPACYGFQQAGSGVYVQKEISDSERAVIVTTIENARRELTDFWGPLEATPSILVCSNDACFRRLGGGGRRGMSLYDRAAVLSPRGSNVTIAAHELSMNELHHRIGIWAFATGRVPIWFDEGIAMYSSNDLRYLSPAIPENQTDRCLVAAPAYLPAGMLEWNRTALTDRQLYAKAACLTSQWMASHGGAPAVLSLVEKIAEGVSFEEASR
jgi:hypothetical protein